VSVPGLGLNHLALVWRSSLSLLAHGITDDARMEWACKASTLLLVTGVLLLRVVYLVWLCPYELVGDEAQYWEWSRRLALSYYSKGPGIAWIIWAAVKLFGTSEWAIRLPSAVAAALAAWFLARLAAACSRGDERVGFVAAVVFCLIPVFHGTAQFMTIDGPYVCCWILACWLAWQLFAQIERQQPALGLWAALGLALGLGFLIKYTIVLLIPGLIWHAVGQRQRLAWNKSALPGVFLGLAVFFCTISPVVLWNWEQGWPTLSHLLGRVHLPGGDLEPHHGWVYNPLWTLEYLASPLVFLGPLGAALMALVLTERLREDHDRSGAAAGCLRFAWRCAVPIIIFYLMVSFGTSVELNWPIAGYTTLLIPVAQTMVAIFAGQRREVASVEADSPAESAPWWRGRVFRPETFKSLWKWFVAIHLVMLMVMSFAYPTVISRLPWIGPRLAIHRIYGHHDFAAKIEAFATRVRQQTGEKPFILADSYWRASLLAFYLPGKPVVFSAASHIGSRKSSYDYFADTDLTDPRLFGRPTLLIGAAAEIWEKAFRFEKLEKLSSTEFPPVFWGSGYHGPVADGYGKFLDRKKFAVLSVP
jgi:4-amino-4-deoxy-L-arabinose transferase-like glycosyltransferase